MTAHDTTSETIKQQFAISGLMSASCHRQRRAEILSNNDRSAGGCRAIAFSRIDAMCGASTIYDCQTLLLSASIK